MIVYMPIEVTVRDLDARLYLSMHLLQKGYDVLFGSKAYVQDYMLRRDHQFILIDKGLTEKQVPFYKTIIAKGGKIVSLDEEGGVFSKDPALLDGRYNPVTLEYVDQVYIWGQNQMDMVLATHPHIPKERFHVSGHPRFDLRKKKFEPYYDAVRTHDHTDYLLFNLSFTTVSLPNFEEYHEFIRNWEGERFNESLFLARHHYHAKLFEEFATAITRLAASFPDLPIVVRPHPADNIDFYHARFEGLDTVMVLRQGSVQEWIPRALLVVHHDCTTAIESYFFEKRVVSYCPILDQGLIQDVPVKISEKAATYETLEALVRETRGDPSLSRIKHTPERTNPIRHIILNTDFDAAAFIAATMAEQFPPVAGRPQMPVRSLLKRSLKRLRALALKTRPPNDAPWLSGKFSPIHKKDLARRMALFRSIEPALPKYHIHPVDESTFLLQAKR